MDQEVFQLGIRHLIEPKLTQNAQGISEVVICLPVLLGWPLERALQMNEELLVIFQFSPSQPIREGRTGQMERSTRTALKKGSFHSSEVRTSATKSDKVR